MSKLDRTEPRFEVVWKARVSVRPGQASQICIHNASAHGLRIIAEQAMQEDQEVTLNLICKHSRKLAAFTLNARVVYNKHFDERMGYKIGVSLIDPPEEYLNLITKMELEGYPLYG